jgi:AcrR family transcriptional regulator
MSVRDNRREAAIERMADFILAEGLAAATLRPLAAAVGTSDRMLLYYFSNKDDLLAATLAKIAARMIAQLDHAIPVGSRRTFSVLLEQVWTALASDSLRPFVPLWLDLASAAARGLQPHRDIAGEIADGFHDWVAVRLHAKGDVEAASSARLFLAAIEGMYLLTAIGREEFAHSALIELITRSQ